MADYNGMEELMASTANLTAIVNGVGHDDDTVTVTGVNWFKYNNTTASSIYVSGNSWFGFGASSEHLRVCRRDAKLWYLWREEGTIYNHYRFLRLKWDGYATYNGSYDSVKLTYEVYLISTGDIFLNITKTPSAGYTGTNALVCTGGTKTYTVTGDQKLMETFTHMAEDGSNFTASVGMINLPMSYSRKYLVSDKNNDIYTVQTVSGVKSLLKLENPGTINGALFEASGADEIPGGSLLLALTDPSVLYWQDTQDALPEIRMQATALPPVQTVFSKNIEMTHPTIKGIESVTADADDAALFAVSFDGGTSWYSYTGGAWTVLTEAQSGMTKTALAGISTDAWALKATTGHIMFRFILTEGGYVNSIVADYLN